MKYFVIILLSFTLNVIAANAQPGTLDESFGDQGKVINKAFYGNCYTIALQQDGKIVTGGYYYNESLKKTAAIIARFNSDGSLDNGFGENGEVLIYESEGENAVGPTSIAIQADGKIVICTRFMDVAEGDVGLIRLNTDGGIDNSFDKDGIAIKSVGKNDLIGEMMLQPDGKILVTGMKGVKESGISPVYALRYLTNGKPDESFGENGLVVLPSTISVRTISALELQIDGKILLAGYDFSRNYTIIRLLADGDLDNLFSEDGIANLIIEKTDQFSSDLEDIALQSNGKILACGSAGSSGDQMTLARFNSDGSVDSTFGEKTGYSILPMPSGLSKAYNVYSNNDESIILTGYYNTGLNTEDFGVVKYNNKGIIDSSFGVNGIGTTSFDFDTYDIGRSSIIQPDGKIVISSSVDIADGNDEQNIALVRFNNEVILPITYNKFTATQTKEYVANHHRIKQQIFCCRA